MTRRSAARHSLSTGLAVSALIHVAALVWIRFDVPVVAVDRETLRRPSAPAGMRVIDLRAADDAPDRARERPAQPAPKPRVAETAQSLVPADEPRAVHSGRVVVSLSPRFTDPRLWARPGEAEALADSHDGNQPARVPDSETATREAEERISAGTRTDRDGNAWGTSPEAPQIGPLRYCGATGSADGCGIASAYPGRYRELEQRTRIFSEIFAQRDRLELDAVLKQRGEAIRKRAEAKRDSARPGG